MKLHTIPTRLGDERIDALDSLVDIYEYDTVYFQAEDVLGEYTDMFQNPQRVIDPVLNRRKDVGDTSLTKRHQFTYPFTAVALHMEILCNADAYQDADVIEYLIEFIRQTTVQIYKSKQPVTEQYPFILFPSATGIICKFGPADVQAYVSNGMNSIMDYQKFPEPIAFGVGQEFKVRLFHNQNSAILTGPAPTAETSYWYAIRAVLKGNKTREIQ